MRKYCFFAVLAIFASVLLASTADADKFLPFRVGWTGIYKCTDNTGNTWEETILVSGKGRAGGHKYFILDFYAEGDMYALHKLIRSTRNEVYDYMGLGTEYVVVQDVPIGTTWTFTNLKGETVERTLEAIETVTVPAGVFEGCFKVRWTYGDSTEIDGCQWFQRGFGLVKEIAYHGRNWPIVNELTSWESASE